MPTELEKALKALNADYDELRTLRAQLATVTAERDAARRALCDAGAFVFLGDYVHLLPATRDLLIELAQETLKADKQASA